MAETFTFFGKFSDAMAFLGEEDQKELCWALVRYGACGEVVDLPPMLAMAFTLMREDIDNSKEARMSGRRGGRSRHKAVPAEPQAPVERKQETYADEAVDGPSREPAKGPSDNGERPLAQAPQRPLAQSPQAIPNHTNTNQTRPDQGKDAPPYAEIVKALNDATGKAFKANNQRTRRLIHARWAEGYRMDDFLSVISTKASEWGREPANEAPANRDAGRGYLFVASLLETFLPGSGFGSRRGRLFLARVCATVRSVSGVACAVVHF